MSEGANICPNCSKTYADDANYCPGCGQKVLDNDIKIGTFVGQFVNDYFTFDSKFFKSVTPLLFKPGYLTKEFFAGHRVRYITPLRLYLFISIVFFLVLGILAPAETNEAVDKLIQVYMPRIFFVLLPLFAAILYLLHNRSTKNFAVHFLFAIHFHSSLFLGGIIYLLISELFSSLDLMVVNLYLAPLFGLAYLVYLFIAMMVVYRLPLWKTALRYILLLILYFIVMTLISLTTLLFLSGN